ncbi:SH3 domain-containing protein [Listeria grandensis FSL F6-0971]|uniref:SH3 domain-containing protein n=2 Tax=Listeria grandensis TaxID=1494963 RepID=W7B6P8_9LIST|nr:hypothetical protein [Listeria grandensis]EUJ20650.1 SH3 domain-containing protein [Listeria grandensis FSL F6-0971]MBC1937501.1 hypothetical protein [Listeria grandensis]
MNKQYIVKVAHQPTESSPLFVNKNEDLWIGERAGNTGWITCTTKMSGKTGLVPEQILSRASLDAKSGTATEDYSARELVVQTGDKVESNRELNGWAWCIDEDDNAGWLPIQKLKR